MTGQKRLWVTQVALSTLESWYVTWEICRDKRDYEARRRAISCKAYGLVWHDRLLLKGLEVFND